jgi:hypothetical protein
LDGNKIPWPKLPESICKRKSKQITTKIIQKNRKKKKTTKVEATKLLARVYAYNPIKPKGTRD